MRSHVVCQPLVEVQVLSTGRQGRDIEGESEGATFQEMVQDL